MLQTTMAIWSWSSSRRTTHEQTGGRDMTEWNAAEYAKRSRLQETMANEVLALLALEGVQHVLDVGCGDGKISAQIAARIPAGTVIGVDPSRDMIAFASNHFPPATQ